MPQEPRLLLAGVALAGLSIVLTARPANAHEDCPKARRPEPAIFGPAYRELEGGVAGTEFPAEGFRLRSWLPLNILHPDATSGNDCWGYVSPSGREYAIMGTSNGTAFVEVTEPGNAQLVAFVPGRGSLWRDIKIHGHFAYSVTEGGGVNSNKAGIQAIDLSQIDAGIVVLAGTQTDGGNGRTHNVAIDEVSGFLYRCGGGSNGLRIYDLNADPVLPPLVGVWPDRYVHDAQIVTYTDGPYAGRQIAFCFSGFNGGSVETGVDILDVTDKSTIVNLSRVEWPLAAYSHQGWLSEDRTILYALDELDEINLGLPTRIHVIDVSNLAKPQWIASVETGTAATTHNGYVVGDRFYAANYRSGMRVYDISNLQAPVEVGFFDTYPELDTAGFSGAWNVYPFLPSGTLIVSDMQRGLFVISPEAPACPADLNGDGVVDGADLGLLLLEWGGAGPVGDVNGDGVIDGQDLNAMLSYWGACPE